MNNTSIAIVRMESESELVEMVSPSTIIKLDDTINTYYNVSIGCAWEIGIVFYNYGIDLDYKVDANTSSIYFGVGMHLICMDLTTGEMMFNRRLDSVFYEIMTDIRSEYYVVMCELDLYVYKNRDLQWKTGFRDTLTDYSIIDEKYIKVLLDNDDELIYAIEDGLLISRVESR